jgi:hypothetical protein
LILYVKLQTNTAKRQTNMSEPASETTAASLLDGMGDHPGVTATDSAAAPASDEMDGYDPAIHATPPRRTAAGTWAMRRGPAPVPGSKRSKKARAARRTRSAPAAVKSEVVIVDTSPAAPPSDPAAPGAPADATSHASCECCDGVPAAPPPNMAHATAVVTVQLIHGPLELMGGPMWKLANDEKEAIESAWEAYYIARGSPDIPPGLVLLGVYAAFAGGRLARPEAQTLRQKLKSWAVNAWYRARYGRPAPKPVGETPAA